MSAGPSTGTVRPATLADLDEVAGLLHRVFGAGQTAEALRWKFTGGAGVLTGSTVLTDDRRIVGFLGQVPVRVRVMGRDVLAAQGTDMAILEEYRRLDAYLGMVQVSVREMRAAGVALTYGTANADAAVLAAELFGIRRLAPVPLLVRPLSANADLGRGARMLAHVLSLLDRTGKTEPTGARGSLRLTAVARFDERFDFFWSEIRDDYPVMLVRDAAHLNRRYVDPPCVEYERLCIEHAASGRIEGYAVLGVRRRNGQRRGHIADLVIARNRDPRTIRLLIHAALAWLRSQAADVAEVWAFPHTRLRRALIGHGFIPRRTGPGGLLVGAQSSGTETDVSAAGSARNWFLAMGDSDTV
jgi:hypothetical protein